MPFANIGTVSLENALRILKENLLAEYAYLGFLVETLPEYRELLARLLVEPEDLLEDVFGTSVEGCGHTFGRDHLVDLRFITGFVRNLERGDSGVAYSLKGKVTSKDSVAESLASQTLRKNFPAYPQSIQKAKPFVCSVWTESCEPATLSRVLEIIENSRQAHLKVRPPVTSGNLDRIQLAKDLGLVTQDFKPE